MLLFGVYGALRLSKITKVTIDDIEDHDTLMLIKIPETKTKISKSFTIGQPYYQLRKKYENKRPKDSAIKRYFLIYQSGNCTKQVIHFSN